jgi:imidazolonepropionase-like amidohydrolase
MFDQTFASKAAAIAFAVSLAVAGSEGIAKSRPAGAKAAVPPSTIALRHARLVDGTNAAPFEDAAIVIVGPRFAYVGPDREAKIPEGAEVFDVRGRTVVPGLIDAHVHMCYPDSREQPFLLNESVASFRAAWHLRRHLMAGITTVMDGGGYRNVGVMAKQAFREGHLLGSRPIVVGERINATGGHGVSRFPMAYEADGPEEFRKAVRVQIKSGADLIKILPPYSRDELEAGLDEAHRLRRIVAVHSGYLTDQYDYVRWAAELGADVIEHAYALPDDVIKMMGEKKIYSVPTMTVMIKNQAGRPPLSPNEIHPYERIFLKLKEAGVRMAVGTDALYEVKREDPDNYFEEVERFVRLGCSPREAIVAATRIGAEVCDAANRLGTIEKGKLADLLVVDGDPLKDIRDLRNVSDIIQEGKWIKK